MIPIYLASIVSEFLKLEHDSLPIMSEFLKLEHDSQPIVFEFF